LQYLCESIELSIEELVIDERRKWGSFDERKSIHGTPELAARTDATRGGQWDPEKGERKKEVARARRSASFKSKSYWPRKRRMTRLFWWAGSPTHTCILGHVHQPTPPDRPNKGVIDGFDLASWSQPGMAWLE
jgi:hypothetical protein